MSYSPVSLSDISSNARIKLYPSSPVLQVSNSPIFREKGFEPVSRNYSVPSKGFSKSPERSIESSLFRARASVRDIARCNQFTHFFTWTLDPSLIDRYDSQVVRRKLSDFLKNMVRRKNFSYVCIPERHQDGAIHIHGLCSLGSLSLFPASNPHTGNLISTNRGQQVFNMPDWKYGFSTCIPLDNNYERAVSYVIKYMTKDTDKIFGKWYWSSRNLKKHPEVVLLDNMDFDSFTHDNPDAYTFNVYRDVKLSCLTLSGGDSYHT